MPRGTLHYADISEHARSPAAQKSTQQHTQGKPTLTLKAPPGVLTLAVPPACSGRAFSQHSDGQPPYLESHQCTAQGSTGAARPGGQAGQGRGTFVSQVHGNSGLSGHCSTGARMEAEDTAFIRFAQSDRIAMQCVGLCLLDFRQSSQCATGSKSINQHHHRPAG